MCGWRRFAMNIFARYETMDPYILLSAVNLKLRDHYDSLEELCATHEIDQAILEQRLKDLGYKYDREQNQFKG